LIKKSYISTTIDGVYMPMMLLKDKRSIKDIIELYELINRFTNINFTQKNKHMQLLICYNFILLFKFYENENIDIGELFNLYYSRFSKISHDLYYDKVSINTINLNQMIKEILPTKDKQKSQISDDEWNLFKSGKMILLPSNTIQQGIDITFMLNDKVYYCQIKNEPNSNRTPSMINEHLKQFHKTINSKTLDIRLKKYNKSCIFVLIWRTKSSMYNLNIDCMDKKYKIYRD